jgi:hypothetical protein
MRSHTSSSRSSRAGYFPGVYTAAGHLVMSALLIHFMLQEPARLKGPGPAAATA